MNYTTIEQSKKLLELGLSPETSDMYYQYVLPHSDKLHHVPNLGEPTQALLWYNKGYTLGGKNKPMTLEEFCIPCWSLGALLEVMPNGVQINSNNTGISIDITFVRNGVIIDSHRVKNDTFLEAAYDMVVWLLENGYIKKGE